MTKTNVFLQELWAMNHLNVAVQGKVALHLDEMDREAKRLRAALLDLYNGTAEYVYLNNLGDPHNTMPMRRASEVLGVAEASAYEI